MGMHVIVPIKPVPDISRVRFDIKRGVIDRSSSLLEINPLDLHALEVALQIKDNIGGKVTVIAMAPPHGDRALRDALARGADRAILLSDIKFAGADTLATSYTLASAIRKLAPFDLIICGEKTIDGDTGQVGPEIAEHLGIPHVAYVISVKNIDKNKIVVTSDLGDLYCEFEITLPALLTVTKDVNTPRQPKLKDLLKARKAKIEIWNAESLSNIADIDKLGLKGSPTRVVKIEFPKDTNKRKGVIFSGSDSVEKLIEVLKLEGIIR